MATFTLPYSGEIDPGQTLDNTDIVERAGYMTIKQMVDAFRESGIVYKTYRSTVHDFASEAEVESADPQLWSTISAYRTAGIDDIDIAAINAGYIEYLKSKVPLPIDSSAPVSPPVQPPLTS